MATFAQIRAERKKSLRQVKALERKTDTSLEIFERRIERILKNVTYIDRETAMTLVPLYNNFIKTLRNLEQGVADYIRMSAF